MFPCGSGSVLQQIQVCQDMIRGITAFATKKTGRLFPKPSPLLQRPSETLLFPRPWSSRSRLFPKPSPLLPGPTATVLFPTSILLSLTRTSGHGRRSWARKVRIPRSFLRRRSRSAKLRRHNLWIGVFLILFHPESLNKKTEIYQSCKHKKFKFLADCNVAMSIEVLGKPPGLI